MSRVDSGSSAVTACKRVFIMDWIASRNVTGSATREVFNVWLFRLHGSQLKKYQEIKLCFTMIKQWKAFICQGVFCRQIIHDRLRSCLYAFKLGT